MQPSGPMQGKSSLYPSVAQAKKLAAIALKYGGLTINPKKTDFFAQRLGGAMTELGMRDYNHYISWLEGPNGSSERKTLVEALTTHTTDFFREPQHFEFLRQTGIAHLVGLGAGRERAFRIWSAACSTGAELYSAMITLDEHMKANGETIRMEGIGTDISTKILQRAKNAVYDESEISGLNHSRRKAYLLRDRTGLPRFRVDPRMRNMCSWSQSNLSETTPNVPSKIDVAFLRNVLIYFDGPTQERVVKNVANTLVPGGYLFTGHSEALTVPPTGLRQVAASTYQKE